MNKIESELINTLKEYVTLLGDEINSMVGIAYAHGWSSKESNIEKGKELRQKIKDLELKCSQNI